MASYLKRLLGALGAYQIASILQKLLAVLLLPVFTGKIPPGGYGIVETLATFVIFVSIVVRFGIIESFLRYYYIDEDPARRDALVRRSVLFLLATTTVACVVLVVPAGPLSRLVTSEHVPGRLPRGGARHLVVHEPRDWPRRCCASTSGSAPTRSSTRSTWWSPCRRLGGAGRRPRQGLRGTADRQLRDQHAGAVRTLVASAPAVAATASQPPPRASARCSASACRPCRPRPRSTR